MTSLFWQSCEGGKFNPETVIGGFDRNSRKKLYLARANIGGEQVPGLLQDSMKTASIPNQGKAVEVDKYEVLVNPQDVYLEWIAPQGDTIPTGAVVGGISKDGKKVFIARTRVGGDWAPGKLITTDGQDTCYVAIGGKEHTSIEFEVMCINTITPQSMVQ